MLNRIRTESGINVSWETHGTGGPHLVLVHGSFSDHRTNWEFVMPLLAERFTVHAIARRGRGETDTTHGHSLLDESEDVAEVIRHIGEPVFLLGHSYGAQVALQTALSVPGRVRKLVFYEGPWPTLIDASVLGVLGEFARAEDWSGLAFWFFRQVLFVPLDELEAVRTSELWGPIIADARASLSDLTALNSYHFRPEAFRNSGVDVLLQTGSMSPRHLYATDALAAVLPHARIEVLTGQAHEAMTTAPDLYAESVFRFLLEGRTAGVSAG